MAKNLQQRILKAASELFYSQGIKATGIDAVVKRAGTNKMSLYNYFASKDDLVVAFLHQRNGEFSAWFVSEVPKRADQPTDKLLAMFDVMAEWMAAPEFRGCAFINAAAEFPAPGNPVQQASVEFYQQFREFITDLAKQCRAPKPDSLAFQLSLLIEGAIVTEQRQRDSGAIIQAKAAAGVLINQALNSPALTVANKKC